jgi:hypothetical protein
MSVVQSNIDPQRELVVGKACAAFPPSICLGRCHAAAPNFARLRP